MKGFYKTYYTLIQNSPAHHAFCRAAYGLDLDQHGFADQEQLKLLLDVTALKSGQRVIDLGCGSGKITEYLSDRTRAYFVGVDKEAVAIAQARERTRTKSQCLDYVVADMNRPGFANHAFDALLSIDSIYFSKSYGETVRRWKSLVKAGGQMAIFFSFGRRLRDQEGQFPVEKLPPDKTDLAEALKMNGLRYRTWDLSAQDDALARRKAAVLADLETQFRSEGAAYLYEDRLRETEGIIQAFKQGLYVRYLYLVQLD